MSNEEIFRLIRSGKEGQVQMVEYLMKDEKLLSGMKKAVSVIRPPAEKEFWDIFDRTIAKFFKRVTLDDSFELDEDLNDYLIQLTLKLWFEDLARILTKDERLKNGIKKVMSGIKPPTDEDFWDIFNRTIMIFLKRIENDRTFSIGTNLNSYLFVIARNLWIQELRRRNESPGELPEDYELTEDSADSIQTLLEKDELRKWLEKLLDKIGEPCKTVLMMWAMGKKMKEIQEALGLKTEGAARKKKYDCMKKLRDFLDGNPGLGDMLK